MVDYSLPVGTFQTPFKQTKNKQNKENANSSI